MNPIVYQVLVVLLAIGIVFLVLIALWRILNMMKSLFGGKKKPDVNQAAVENKLNPAVTEATASNAANEMDADEIIAVITAAIHACMGSQSNLIVRSITRVGDNTPVWGQIGRHEQMLNRL